MKAPTFEEAENIILKADIDKALESMENCRKMLIEARETWGKIGELFRDLAKIDTATEFGEVTPDDSKEGAIL